MPVKTSKPALTRRVARALQFLTEPQDDGHVLRPTAVAQLVAERFRVNIRTAWADVRAAQDAISREAVADLPAMKLYIVKELQDAIEEAKAQRDPKARVRALAELAKVTGANAPQQVELSAKAGVMVVAGVAATPEQWIAAHAAAGEAKPPNGSNGHKGGNGVKP